MFNSSGKYGKTAPLSSWARGTFLPIVGTNAIIHHLKALVVQVSNLNDGLAKLRLSRDLKRQRSF